MTRPDQQIKFTDLQFTNQPFGFDTEGMDASQFIREAGNLDLMTAAQIAAVYRHAKDVLEQLEETRSVLSSFVELIKTNKLPAAFEREQLKTITLVDGARVTVQQRTFATMLDKDGGKEWLRTNGLGDLIQETVNASTLSSLAKDVLLGGMEDRGIHDLPESLFKVEIRPTTSVTKGN